MITLEKEFESNANGTGLMTFQQIKAGSRVHINKRTKEKQTQRIYVYKRVRKDGSIFGWEVILPRISEAGTVQKFPNGTTSTIEEDTEFYPGGSLFGSSAWFVNSEARAMERFNELVNGSSDKEQDENVIPIPNHEFAVKDYAEELGVPYIEVSNWSQKQIREGRLKVVRKERRAQRGRATNILARA